MKKNKMLSLLLALVMVLSLLPAGAVTTHAADQDVWVDVTTDADPANLTGTMSPEGEIYYQSYLGNGNETTYTVSVRSNDYNNGGKATGSYLSLDSSSLVKTGTAAAGDIVTIHVNMQPGTDFYYFKDGDDDIIVTNMTDYSYIETTKVNDTTYTFVMPAERHRNRWKATRERSARR